MTRLCMCYITKRNFAILLCILVIMMPLLKLLLPAPLQYTDMYHLFRVVNERQSFPVDNEALGEEDTESLDLIKVKKQIISIHFKKMGNILDKNKYVNDSVLIHFVPTTSLNDRVNMLITLQVFVQNCERTNLTYLLWGGSLLGAYRHQGFIPWDDDMDVVMNGSDWWTVRNVLSHVPGYELFVRSDDHWKFYRKDHNSFPGQVYKWPFIDIFFFTEDSTHLWALSKSIKFELVNRIDDIFPLQLRQFENIRVMVPCKMEEIVLRVYIIRDCLSPSSSHRNGVPISSSNIKNIPCSKLYNIFSFVFRIKDPNSKNTIEILKRGDNILRTISVPTKLCKQKRLSYCDGSSK